MKDVVLHWTGGTYTASEYEKTCYHSLTEGDGTWVEGYKPPEANRGPLGPDYVRHTGGGNTDRIGHAICGMGGSEVRERPLNMGRYPITMKQIDAAARDIAEKYCTVYDIDPANVETHAEFYQRTGRGSYKWDITCLEGDTEVRSAKEVGDMIRGKIRAHLAARPRPEPAATPTPGGVAAIIAAIAALFKGSKT